MSAFNARSERALARDFIASSRKAGHAAALARYIADGVMLSASEQRHSWGGYVEPFKIAKGIAKRLDPTATIDYIRFNQRWALKWVGEDTLHDPRRGDLLWVGDAAHPKTPWELKDARLYTCRQCVSTDVHDVVVKSEERWRHRGGVQWTSDGRWYIDHDTVNVWMEDAKREWRKEAGESWWRCMRKADWDQVYTVVREGGFSKADFMEWLDQRAWDRGMDWSVEDGASPATEEGVPSSSDQEREPSVYDLDMGWERLEGFLERGYMAPTPPIVSLD